jgi:aconitate hydratase
MAQQFDHFGARDTFDTGSGRAVIYRLSALQSLGNIHRLPVSVRIMLEQALRQVDDFEVTREDVEHIARWNGELDTSREIPFKPARVILQDFTGVPSVVDLAALRSAMAALGGDAERINPLVPVDLVIDHSVQVDQFGTDAALFFNAEREFERNRERYEFLRWGQKAFRNFSVVPPATGIVHQVNLEFLAKVVQLRGQGDDVVAFPDTLVGTDSHTTMINGLGIVGWGVGGIEAEAVMLGQPIYMLMPQVTGFKLTGTLPEGATATDLVLTVTQMLREHGVVGRFVEFYGQGLSQLSLADRATIGNMAPEYGATMGFFPVDEETLRYLRMTGRPDELVQLVERYNKEQGLFRTDETEDPFFTDTLSLDLSSVEVSLAGPKRPQDRVPLTEMKSSFQQALRAPAGIKGFGLHDEGLDRTALVRDNGSSVPITHGAVAIAAITSCTNTSNPSVMVGAGLLAKKAVERGLTVPPYVKTSLAPGSRVVTEYLDKAGLTPYLDQLGFNLVGYGCTTCIGNSGPLPEAVSDAINEGNLVAAAVLSGNRNFEGRINPYTRANYLASPPLVVAYALAGTVDKNLVTEPLGEDQNGNPVYLSDIWPAPDEIQETIRSTITPEIFNEQYGNVYNGNEQWNEIPVPEGALYEWRDDSTYIQHPPFFQNLPPEPQPLQDIRGARVLVLLGDSVTTDHISPASSIAVKSPAGQYLIEKGVEPRDFNSYGSRRGNHEVMMRGTFANARLRNQLVPGSEGPRTLHLPTGEESFIYDASMRYQEEGTPLVVLAGKEYGTGSSRDWAAKGTYLLGVHAVIAESYERIHRSNLVGMGVLPLQFMPGEGWQSLGLTGHEHFDIQGISDTMQPGSTVTVTARRDDGTETTFEARARLDTPVEVNYYRNGGILHTVLRAIARGSQQA